MTWESEGNSEKEVQILPGRGNYQMNIDRCRKTERIKRLEV